MSPEPEHEATIFMCGPNRTCDHVMDKYEPIFDGGVEVGSTLVCSKCGETSFNLSMWSD